MKILFVMTAREVGGAEHYILRLARALHGQCQLTVAMARHPNLRAFSQALSAWATVEPFDFDRPLALPRVTHALQQLAVRHHVVHINSNHPASRLGIWAAWALSQTATPVICVEQRATPIADVRVPPYLAWALPTLFRWSRRRVVRTVAVSQDNAKVLTEYYKLPTAQLQVIYTSSEVNALQQQLRDHASTLRAELGLTEATRVITVLARIAPNKGQRYLVEAAPAILAEHPHAHFVLVGPREDPLVEQAIAEYGLTDRFSLIGYREDIANIFGGSDVAVLPSLGEGFALSIVDALACGVPMVATRVGGAVEILRDGENGWLVPPANAPALAQAINTVLAADPDVYQRYRRAALESARPFAIETLAQNMLALYRAVARL